MSFNKMYLKLGKTGHFIPKFLRRSQVGWRDGSVVKSTGWLLKTQVQFPKVIVSKTPRLKKSEAL